MLPSIHFEGTLTKDPVIKFTPNGTAIASINVAVNERKKNEQGEWVNGEATFLTCYVWRKMGENAVDSLHKGDNVVVIGRYKSRGWEDNDGNKRTAQEVDVDSIGLSLRYESIEGGKSNMKSDKSWSDEAPF